MLVDQLSKKELLSLVEELLASNASLLRKVDELTKEVVRLQEEVRTLKSKKNSGNSSVPPSSDPNRPISNRSLRRKSGRKTGGQSGHKGHNLEMSQSPDVVIEHQPHYCQVCGLGLDVSSCLLTERRQVVDIPTISPVYTEHRVYSKTCLCGHVAQSRFPSEVKATIQYGAGLESMASYFSVRQYLPYKRMKECFGDLFGLSISEATLVKAVRQMAFKSQPVYDRIKANILQSKVVGADETGAKVNGSKAWFWTWQNPKNTLITLDSSRGFKAIESVFPDGLPNSILVSDCWAAQLKTQAVSHQLCIAHLLRELNFFIQSYDDYWAKSLRQLFLDGIRLKYEIEDYQSEQPFRKRLNQRLDELLAFDIDKQPEKLRPFHKRLRKNRDYLFPFLYHQQVPSDNNASERAIRNLKVKQKISGQFVSQKGANAFAVIRSVIDTTIKNNANVFNALKTIAKFTPE